MEAEILIEKVVEIIKLAFISTLSVVLFIMLLTHLVWFLFPEKRDSFPFGKIEKKKVKKNKKKSKKKNKKKSK